MTTKHRIGIIWCTLGVLNISILSSCRHTSLEDKAAKDVKDFTEKYCPTPVQNFQRTDSITFDRSTHTFTYHHVLCGDADHADIINKIKPTIHTALINDLKGNTSTKTYKEQGYSFHYVFRSQKTKAILYEETLTKKDYHQ